MNIRGFGRIYDGSSGRVRPKTSYILRDRTGHQFDGLRKIAKVLAKFVHVPLVQACAVKSHLTQTDRPGANNKSGKCGLSRCTRADDAERASGLKVE